MSTFQQQVEVFQLAFLDVVGYVVDAAFASAPSQTPQQLLQQYHQSRLAEALAKALNTPGVAWPATALSLLVPSVGEFKQFDPESNRFGPEGAAAVNGPQPAYPISTLTDMFIAKLRKGAWSTNPVACQAFSSTFSALADAGVEAVNTGSIPSASDIASSILAGHKRRNACNNVDYLLDDVVDELVKAYPSVVDALVPLIDVDGDSLIDVDNYEVVQDLVAPVGDGSASLEEKEALKLTALMAPYLKAAGGTGAAAAEGGKVMWSSDAAALAERTIVLVQQLSHAYMDVVNAVMRPFVVDRVIDGVLQVADKNSDGTLTLDELQAWLSRRR